ncbi:tail fiber domain-containing protein [uncultured Draconibacterium sp.]|uniref:tail fiber domain-containing protein n=1 Tax=uncultured Draconibacterium sp. TaxID=1573823 RepID=UPI0025CC98DF|nr:tail fiber domain-containing protein [uncultured Draconibacterium sp.]
MKKHLLFTFFLMVSVWAFGQKLPFQGKIIESGFPVNDTRTFVFEIASVGWSESHADVTITDGLYFVVLGSINPLPDSLFYGVTEQSMAISVGGVALSPVTLFKPLSAPFEGGELVVHNDEGTVVGEMKALSLGDNKNGEVNVYGTNGSKNITLGAISHWQTPGNDFGWMYLSNDEGEGKVTLGVTPYHGVHGSGEFTLRGETDGVLAAGYNSYNNVSNYPFLNFQTKMGIENIHASIKVSVQDTVEYGELSLTSSNNEEMYLSPNKLTTKKNGTELVSLSTQDWGGQGESGFIGVNGPSGMPNIEMTSKSWENAELPWLKMVGTSWNDIVQISASNDSTESGYMNLFSVDNKEASFYASGIRFNTTGDNGSELVSVNIENRDDSGYAGYFNLNGPNSGNIGMGSRHWEGKADLPLINLYGENYFHGMEISIVPDGNGDQYGFINLLSENGKSLHLYPEGLGIEGVGMNTQNNGADNFGYLFTRGPNTTNFETGGDWNNPDRAYLNLNGATDENRFHVGVYEDGQQNEFGSVDISGSNQQLTSIQPNIISLNRTGDNWREFANMNMWANPDTGTGMHGTITLNGPESLNFRIRSRDWENANLPQLALYGENDFEAMELSVLPDGNGDQYGFINLISENGKSLHLSPEGFGIDKVSLNTVNENGGSSGQIFLHGTNSPNIQIGGQPWHNNDLGFFTVFTDKPDGNGWYYGAANISASTDGTDSWGSMSLNNNDMQRITLDGQSGSIHGIAQDGRRAILAPDEILVTRADWSAVASLRNAGDYGEMQLNGPNSNNVIIGGQGNPDRPYFYMRGENDFHAVEVSVIDDGAGNQLGSLNLMSGDGTRASYDPTGLWMDKARIDNGAYGYMELSGPNTSNLQLGARGDNADLPRIDMTGTDPNYSIVSISANPGDESGYVYVAGNNESYWTNYAADGIHSSEPLQIHNSAVIYGVLTINGDTLYAGVSDRRYKKNIQSLGNDILGKVEQVRGVSYDWRKDEFPEKHFTTAKQIGVIAQELEAQFPELVKTNAEGYKSVNYDGLSAVLIEAVKELNAKVERLESENSQLKAELSASAANATEIETLKAQMKTVLKAVQEASVLPVDEELTSTSGLK